MVAIFLDDTDVPKAIEILDNAGIYASGGSGCVYVDLGCLEIAEKELFSFGINCWPC